MILTLFFMISAHANQPAYPQPPLAMKLPAPLPLQAIQIAPGKYRANCPAYNNMKNAVDFQIDCSRFSDPDSLSLCQTYIQNNGCNVYHAAENITGLHLADRCSEYLYVIFPKDWPGAASLGGFSTWSVVNHICLTHYNEKYSIRSVLPSSVGPFDNHEIIHHLQYLAQANLGMPIAQYGYFLPNPTGHSLFSSTMLELIAQVEGGTSGLRYQTQLASFQKQQTNLANTINTAVSQGKPVDCVMLTEYEETFLYFKDRSVVSKYYAGLGNYPNVTPLQRMEMLLYDSGRTISWNGDWVSQLDVKTNCRWW